MKVKKSAMSYCFTASLLLYFGQHITVTSCGEQFLPPIVVLTTETLNLSHWRNHLDVDIVALPTVNLSFYDVVEAANMISRAVNRRQNTSMAIIGSGNAMIDGLIARTAGLLSLPFISITRHDNYQNQLFLNFIPSSTDNSHIERDLAFELGCQHIAVFTSEYASSTAQKQVEVKARDRSISSIEIQLPLSLLKLADVFYQMRKYSSVLVVLDCTKEEAIYLIEASKMAFVSTVQFHWLISKSMKDEIDNVEFLPPEVLGIRSKFDEQKWVHDALTLLNYSLHVWTRSDNDKDGCVSRSYDTPSRELYRRMLTQKFKGNTGWVQFNEEGIRVGASYDIVKTTSSKSSRNGTSWVTVGSVEGFQFSLDKSFWMQEIQDHKLFVRVVVTEEEPMLVVLKENVGRDSECLLSYPCMRYIQYGNQSNDVRSVKCCCSGFLIDILLWLVRDISIEVKLYLVQDGKFGSLDPVSKQWDGMIADLLSNKTDMALTTFTVTSIRTKAVDFSYPFFYGETKILISSDSSLAHAGTFGFLAPFDVILWTTFIGSVTAILGIVWALERKSPHGNSREINKFSLSTCMWYIWSNVVKLELESMKPQSLSARFTTAVFSFCTLIIVTSYTANLTASLVQTEDVFPVTGIDDPKDPPPGFTFTTLQSSATLSFFTGSDDVAYRRIGRNMMPHLVKSYSEGLDKLNNGELDAFIYDSPFIDLGAAKMPGCSFQVVGSPIFTKAYAVAFPKESELRDPVTNLLLKYQRNDYFRKLTDKWFQGSCLKSKRSHHNAYKMKPGHLSGFLFICCGAVAICFVILLVEYLWSCKLRRKGKYTANSQVDCTKHCHKVCKRDK